MAGVRAVAAVALSLVLLAASPVAGGTFHERVLPAGDGPESRERRYQVFLPEAAAGADAPPALVAVLHGCRQTEANMIAETGFAELAETEGFVVVYPFVTSYAPLPPRFPNCWGFWLEPQRTKGSGEVADIRRILAAVEDEFGTDPDRRYAAGLSSGGAMAVVLGVVYSEDIAAVGAVAGLSYGERADAVTASCAEQPTTRSPDEIAGAMAAARVGSDARRLVPLMVIQSLHDCTVQRVNGEVLRDGWLLHHGGAPAPAEERDCRVGAIACSHARHVDAAGRTVVETVFYAGAEDQGSHHWPGDNAGPFADPRGPSASGLLWTFFAGHRREAGDAVDLAVASAEVRSVTLSLAGRARAGAGIARLAVRLEGEGDPGAKDALLAGDAWTVEFEAVPTDRYYVPVLTATLEDGSEVVRSGERIAVGRPDPVIRAVGTWHQHLVARRIAEPGEACTNQSFGVCDRDFTEIFSRHGIAPFPLYQPEGGSDWYSSREGALGEDGDG